MAIRSRGAEGNCRFGPELEAMADFKPGHSRPVTAVAAELVMKRLRVVGDKVAPV